MYGYNHGYQVVIQCAGALQDYIDSVFGENAGEVPQVSISLSHCSALIEVEEMEVWHSESSPFELTTESAIESFKEKCGEWARFSVVSSH